uniref:Secreted protein n=1 Tax=Globodera pallida TaxID=36090 RepID=A0A183CFK8_GLOPA
MPEIPLSTSIIKWGLIWFISGTELAGTELARDGVGWDGVGGTELAGTELAGRSWPVSGICIARSHHFPRSIGLIKSCRLQLKIDIQRRRRAHTHSNTN